MKTISDPAMLLWMFKPLWVIERLIYLTSLKGWRYISVANASVTKASGRTLSLTNHRNKKGFQYGTWLATSKKIQAGKGTRSAAIEFRVILLSVECCLSHHSPFTACCFREHLSTDGEASGWGTQGLSLPPAQTPPPSVPPTRSRQPTFHPHKVLLKDRSAARILFFWALSKLQIDFTGWRSILLIRPKDNAANWPDLCKIESLHVES